jgi:hypothetical protein
VHPSNLRELALEPSVVIPSSLCWGCDVSRPLIQN